MKVLLCHNYYANRGGEDQSFEDEANLLEAAGHRVLRYCLHNDALQDRGRIAAAKDAFWNSRAYRDVAAILRIERPELVHCTNLFPLMSPSVYYAANDAGVPVLQALRNYRWLCPSFSFLRNGKPCEDCAGKAFAWPGVVHGCYRGSRLATGVVAGSFAWHRALGAWSRRVTMHYTLTEFARRKFVQYGLAPDRVVVKRNSVAPDLGFADGPREGAIFVGRLSEEKGLGVVLEAWRRIDSSCSLEIIGDGPLASSVRSAAAADSRIRWSGELPLEEVLARIGRAKVLICPSIWYETFGRVIAEAYSRGTPVIASDLGAMTELIEPGVTGDLFPPGDAEALARRVAALLTDEDGRSAMGAAARTAYERCFRPEINYRRLMEIYDLTLSRTASAKEPGNRRSPLSVDTAAANVHEQSSASPSDGVPRAGIRRTSDD